MLDEVVPALFAAQGGCAHRRQLLACGLTRHQIDGRVQRGSWVETQPHVYQPAGLPDTHVSRCWAAYLAVLHAGAPSPNQRRAAVVGHAAAALLVAQWPEPREVEIGTQFRSHLIDLREATHHRLRTWPRREFVRVRGLVVSSMTDTIVDVASALTAAELLTLVQDQVFRSTTSTRALRRRCGRGVAGSTAVRAACLDVDTGIESTSAKIGVRALREAGFVVETGVPLLRGFGRTDFFIAGRRPGRRYGLAGEIDGPHHELREQREYDDRKDDAAEAAGYTPKRYDADFVRSSPRDFVAVVTRHVAELEAAAAAAPPFRVRPTG